MANAAFAEGAEVYANRDDGGGSMHYFALCRISAKLAREGAGAVSYTHLDVYKRQVVIFGLVEGNVHATGRIELRDSAVVKGDLIAGRLSIEESVSMKGRVQLQERTAGARPGAGAGVEMPASVAMPTGA